MWRTGFLLTSLALLGGCSAKLFMTDNVLSHFGRDIFQFDHFRPDFNELSKHPYMKNYHNETDCIQNLISNSFLKSRLRKSKLNITGEYEKSDDAPHDYRHRRSYDAGDKDIMLMYVDQGDYNPFIELEIMIKIPLFQVYEHTFVNFEIPINFEIPMSYFSANIITGREWTSEIQPALDDLEGIVSMLGVDGHSCVLRSVCEIAESPMIRPEGIVGEMLEIFINYLTLETPESNEIDGEDEILSRRRRDYSEASHKGRYIGGCDEHYATCPISLFNIRASAFM